MPLDLAGARLLALAIRPNKANGATKTWDRVLIASGRARRSRRDPLPWHEAVYADIGDTQSIAQDLSTFTAHLTRLKAALEGAGPGTLILIDEIGASTDPTEGAALAVALLEAWTARGARTIVTTHYHTLKISAARGSGMSTIAGLRPERTRPVRFVRAFRAARSDRARRALGLQPARRTGRDAHRGARDLDEVPRRWPREEAALLSAAPSPGGAAAIGAAESRGARIASEAWIGGGAERRL